MQLKSLPCYCATLRQAARAATVLYEDMLADSGLPATQYTVLQLLDSVPVLFENINAFMPRHVRKTVVCLRGEIGNRSDVFLDPELALV